jgi:hypothetical protein
MPSMHIYIFFFTHIFRIVAFDNRRNVQVEPDLGHHLIFEVNIQILKKSERYSSRVGVDPSFEKMSHFLKLMLILSSLHSTPPV